ncbi:hypothetical protein Bwad006_36610 [Bilophila wadsworthia]
MGQLGRKFKELFLSKNPECPSAYAACEPSRTFPASQALRREGERKGGGAS